MKKNKKILYKCMTIFVLAIIMFYTCLIGQVFARDNFAFSVATMWGNLDTRYAMNVASYAYADAGYHAYGLTDPSKQQAFENMYADVQFYDSHGNVDHIQFANFGIVRGNGGTFNVEGNPKEFIGTNEVNWGIDNTILVTYISCNGSGANDINDNESLCAYTVRQGSNVVLGFRESVETGSLTEWSTRYNQKLGEGYGVLDAANYANSFSYNDDNVKCSTVWHHGDPNIKIGKYRSVTSSIDQRNILNNAHSLQYSKNNIVEIIKNNYNNFDINNYVIEESSGTQTVNINTIDTEQVTTYIDLKLKIGDYITNAGYTIEIKNDIISAIYDNNINLEEQEKLLERKDEFTIDLDSQEENLYKSRASNLVKTTYKNAIISDDITTEYYYDIYNHKKMILVNVPNEIYSEDGLMPSVSVETIRFEI